MSSGNRHAGLLGEIEYPAPATATVSNVRSWADVGTALLCAACSFVWAHWQIYVLGTAHVCPASAAGSTEYKNGTPKNRSSSHCSSESVLHNELGLQRVVVTCAPGQGNMQIFSKPPRHRIPEFLQHGISLLQHRASGSLREGGHYVRAAVVTFISAVQEPVTDLPPPLHPQPHWLATLA